MRIRKHRVAFILLLNSLPHLLADDSSHLIPETDNGGDSNNDDDIVVRLDQQEQQEGKPEEQQQKEQQLKESQEEDHGVPPTKREDDLVELEEVVEQIIEEESEKEVEEQEINQVEVEPLARPQQQDTGEVQQDNVGRLTPSMDYEDPKFEEEEQIPEDCASSLAAEDSVHEDVDTIDTKSDFDSESNESVDNSDEGTENLPEETEDNASQALHGDGFRLPALSKIDTIVEGASDTEATTDETNQHQDDSSMEESEIINTEVSPVEEEIQPKEPSEIVKEKDDDHDMEQKDADRDMLYKNGHTNIESSEITNDQGLERVVVEDDSDTNISDATKEQGIEVVSLKGDDDTKLSDSTKDPVVGEVVIEDDIKISETAEEPELEKIMTEGNGEVKNIETAEESRLEEVVTRDDDIKISESTEDPGLEEVVIEGEDSGSFGSSGTTNTDEPEVEDEEVIVLQDAKISIGTTSTKPMEEEEDGAIIDGEAPEENGVEASQQEVNPGQNTGNDTIETSLENATEGLSGSETDQSRVIEPITSEDHDVEVVVSEEEENNNSNTRDAQDIVDGSDLGAFTDDEGKIEGEEKAGNDEGKDIVEGFEDDDDEDDEDLAYRVSVDYASKSAGAIIIEKTAEFKGTSNLITGDRDRYAIVPCSEEKKHVVLGLSEDILVKEIKLANYERFSSTVKDFQVKGSHTLGKWVDLGTFKAKSGNGEQSFVLETPGWARYLKFKFLTHHGNEWFCTLSQIKVHGSNMVQDFHEHWESIEENKEEELEGDQTGDATQTFNADESGTDTNANDTARETKSDGYLSNSSVAREEDSSVSDGNADLGSIEKGDLGPRHAQVTPSVHLKPKPLQQFRSHMTFSEIIQVEIGDEKIFSDLYNLIPHAHCSLPAHAKNDLTCRELDHEMRSVHQIGRLAMDSLYKFGTKIVDDFAVVGTDTIRIASPKMDYSSDEFYQKRFGSEISSLVHFYANNIVYPTSPSHLDPSRDTVTDGNSIDGANESASHEEKKGEVALAGTKSSLPTTKKEEPSAKANSKLSIEGNNDSLDFAIQKLLRDLPSAECLVHLDFSEFKSKIATTRKSTSASGGSQGGRVMEPIFKKLTDEIFALQTSLSVHDQFSKLSVGCYQRVILDLALETEKVRREQDDRLRRLEEQILEPASMRMFQKLVVSLASTTAKWLISNAYYLFLTVKNVWVPKLLKYYLSKDTYGSLKETFETTQGYWSLASNVVFVVVDYLRKGIVMLTRALDSNGWANFETYQEYLSAWSSYYDGGMTVVFIVITLIVLRLVMMCSWILRPKKRERRSLRSPRTSSSRISSPRSYPEEGLYAPLSLSSKKYKKKSSKSKRRSRDQTVVSAVEDIASKPSAQDISTKPSVDSISTKPSEETIPEDQTVVPAVEDIVSKPSAQDISTKPSMESIATNPSEEAIPELREELVHESSSTPKGNIPSNGRENRTTAISPSVVSVEGE